MAFYMSYIIYPYVQPTNSFGRINISESWKTISSIYICIGETWKTVTLINICISGGWQNLIT